MPDIASPPNETVLDLESLSTDVVKLAMKAGASDAEVVVREGDEFSVNVRMGEVETLKESGSRALGLRVFQGKRSASASTSDLTADGIRQLVDGAMALANVTEEDPFIGLPETEEFGSIKDDLHLYYDDVYSLRARSGLNGRGGQRLLLWQRTRASRTPMAGVSTRRRAEDAGELARVCGELSVELCGGFGCSAGPG